MEVCGGHLTSRPEPVGGKQQLLELALPDSELSLRILATHKSDTGQDTFPCQPLELPCKTQSKRKTTRREDPHWLPHLVSASSTLRSVLKMKEQFSYVWTPFVTLMTWEIPFPSLIFLYASKKTMSRLHPLLHLLCASFKSCWVVVVGFFST